MGENARLLTIPEAAEALGLPAQSLLRAAEQHGHLVRMGRAVRILESELGELIDKCRCQPKAPASSSGNEKDAPPSMPSRTDPPKSARAQEIADKLKSASQNTSPPRTGELVPLRPAK